LDPLLFLTFLGFKTEYRRFFGDIDTPLYYFIAIMALLPKKPFESQGKLNIPICYYVFVIAY